MYGVADSPHGSGTLVTVAAGCVLALGAAIFFSHRRAGDDATIAAADSPESSMGTMAPAVPPSKRQVATDATVHPPATSARQVLADYWGEEWPEIEARMTQGAREAGVAVDLDRPFAFTPWEEAAPQLETLVPLAEESLDGLTRSKVLWSEELTTSWLSTWCPSVPIPKDGFTPEELAEIEWIAAPHNQQLRSLGEEWAALADSHLWAQWKSGDFEKAPFSTIGVSQEKGFLAKVYASNGWSFVLVLKEEECPDMAQLQREIDAARDARESAIAEYARRLRDR